MNLTATAKLYVNKDSECCIETDAGICTGWHLHLGNALREAGIELEDLIQVGAFQWADSNWNEADGITVSYNTVTYYVNPDGSAEARYFVKEEGEPERLDYIDEFAPGTWRLGRQLRKCGSWSGYEVWRVTGI